MIIQIVEDDRALSDGVCLALKEPDIVFIQSGNIRQAREAFEKQTPDIIILDVNLPDGSGYDYLKWVKQKAEVMVIMLTANDMEMDEVMGLTLGADDYMTKPFSLAVLRARIQLLRKRIVPRSASGFSPASGKQAERIYEDDMFYFNFDRLRFFRNGQEIFLSVNEQKLLRLLVENQDKVLTRNLLLDRLWSDGGEYVDENALSVTVNRLRKKLNDKGMNISYIQTIYGQGYMWKRKG